VTVHLLRFFLLLLLLLLFPPKFLISYETGNVTDKAKDVFVQLATSGMQDAERILYDSTPRITYQ
jgi:hypothetical protein